MPSVLNIRVHGVPEGAVLCDRSTKWGNPFIIGRDGTREEVIEKYDEHLYQSGLAEDLHELRGRDLVCHCAPKPCHCDVLIKRANG